MRRRWFTTSVIADCAKCGRVIGTVPEARALAKCPECGHDGTQRAPSSETSPANPAAKEGPNRDR
jgi:predicted  nucleic acid-binding Zn-ribbon protein